MEMSIMKTGLSVISLAALLFLATWALLIQRPGYMLGTVTMLWFKTLARVIGAGLILMMMGAANQLLQTALFWRW